MLSSSLASLHCEFDFYAQSPSYLAHTYTCTAGPTGLLTWTTGSATAMDLGNLMIVTSASHSAKLCRTIILWWVQSAVEQLSVSLPLWTLTSHLLSKKCRTAWGSTEDTHASSSVSAEYHATPSFTPLQSDSLRVTRREREREREGGGGG